MLIHVPDNLQVENNRTELLKHPLVARLIEYKWRKVAFPLFVAYISVYLLFLTLLTAFAMVSPRPGPESDVCEGGREGGRDREGERGRHGGNGRGEGEVSFVSGMDG